jgi:hypothetical protein
MDNHTIHLSDLGFWLKGSATHVVVKDAGVKKVETSAVLIDRCGERQYWARKGGVRVLQLV